MYPYLIGSHLGRRFNWGCDLCHFGGSFVKKMRSHAPINTSKTNDTHFAQSEEEKERRRGGPSSTKRLEPTLEKGWPFSPAFQTQPKKKEGRGLGLLHKNDSNPPFKRGVHPSPFSPAFQTQLEKKGGKKKGGASSTKTTRTHPSKRVSHPLPFYPAFQTHHNNNYYYLFFLFFIQNKNKTKNAPPRPAPTPRHAEPKQLPTPGRRWPSLPAVEAGHLQLERHQSHGRYLLR